MMKNLLLMSVFGVFMTVAFAGQSVSTLSFAAPAIAGDDHESNDNDEVSDNDSDNTNSIAFSCPEGVTTCYRADGSEYTDVNNFTATAAGIENDGEHENDDDEHDDAYVSTTGTATYANPRHYRSF